MDSHMGETRFKSKSLRLKDALRIKSAEFWLKLGEPGQAVLELRQVPKRVWNHPAMKLVLRSGCRARNH
jgi:hypothetical protein